MVRSKQYCNRLIVLFILLSGFCNKMTGQGNCLIYPAESGERTACEMSYRAIEYRQGSRESQIVFDSAIAVGPNYAYAFYEKSVPYFKRGLLSQGLALINKAIEIDPLTYFYYRAYWYYAHQSYEKCIDDLEEYYKMPHAYSQETPGGEMNMKMILAMCYLETGELAKAMQTASEHAATFKDVEYMGPYDNYIIGVCHYMNQEYKQAGTALRHQLDRFEDFADAYYYLGLVHKTQGKIDTAQEYLTRALELKENPPSGQLRNTMYVPVGKDEIERILLTD